MELSDIPVLGKYVPLAMAIAFVVQAFRSVPKLETFFTEGTVGKIVLRSLPLALGLAAAFAMKAWGGEDGEPLVRGICAGGMSGYVYDLYVKLMKKKSDAVQPPPAK